MLPPAVNDRGDIGSGVLKTAGLVAVILGVFLALSSWDGLYDAIDLPKANPALSAQIGGAALIAVGYLLWVAGSRTELIGIVAAAGAVLYGVLAVLIAAWVIFRSNLELGIDTQGEVTLIVIAVILAGLALALARPALEERPIE